MDIYSFPFRFPEKIGGNLSGVHYIRDVSDADSLISSLVSSLYFYYSALHKTDILKLVY